MFTRSQNKLINRLEFGSIPLTKLSRAEQKVEDQLREMGLTQSVRDVKTGEFSVMLIDEHVEAHRETYRSMYTKKLVADFKLLGKKFRRTTVKPYKVASGCKVRYEGSDGRTSEVTVASWSSGSQADAMKALERRVSYDFSRMNQETQILPWGTKVTLLALEHVEVKEVP